MNRKHNHFLLTAALASGLAFAGSPARADSVITTDGDLIVGKVTKTALGYTVETSSGSVDVAKEKVRKILWDHPQSNQTDTPAVPVKVTDPRMVNALIGQGKAAYETGEFTDARDAFADALSLDTTNSIAGRGLGFAYLKLAKPAKAVKPLELAALGPQPMDRDLTMGLSSALVVSHNPARAVKMLKGYLEAHPSPMDELVINALGIALAQVDHSARRGTLYVDGMKLYKKLNDELEAAQTGKKRWGTLWLPADEVTQKQKQFDDAQKKFDDATAKLQDAKIKVSLLQSDLSVAQGSTQGRAARESRIKKIQDQLNQATSDEQKAQSTYDDAGKTLADLPVPPFPENIPLAGVDLSMGANPVVASATPSSPAVKTDPPPAWKSNRLKPVPHTPAVEPSDATAPPPAADPSPQHVTRYAVAFAIAPDVLVTAASVVEDATDIQVTTSDGRSQKAHIMRSHHSDGLTLLKVDGAHFPCLKLADTAPGEASNSLTCLGYPEVDLFNPMPKSIAASGGNQGDEWTVRFDTCPRLPGGPLIIGNTVVGVELGDRDSDLSQVPAATLKSLLGLVQDSATGDPPAKDAKQAVVQVMAEQ